MNNIPATMEAEGRQIMEDKDDGVSLRSFTEVVTFADRASKTEMVPKQYRGKPDDIVVSIMQGMELGLRPLASLKSIAVINGIPSIYGDAPLALVYKSGKLEYIKETLDEDAEQGGMVATCRVKRINQPEIIQTYSVDDAKKAGLWGKSGPWQTAPKRMLKFRARSFALRDGFPDVLNGIDIYEEVIDRPAMRDVTPESDPEPETKGTAGLKNKLTGRKKPEEPTVTLAEVKKAMKAAANQIELDEAAKKAAGLTSDADKQKARQAYAERRDELNAAATTQAQGGIADMIKSELRQVAGPEGVEAVLSTYREQLEAMEGSDAASYQSILELADEREGAA